MLSVNQISTYYGKIQAIKEVSIEVPEGSIVSILGANGAGKTTTMKTIAGIMNPKEGSVQFFDEKVSGNRPDQLVKKGMSLVPEGRAILAGMTVLENLEMGAFLRKGPEVKRDLERVMDRFPILRERKSQLGGTLSGGQQQMLAIARALMSKPKLLLLDEPSMGLAPLIVKDIFQIIKEINEGGTTVLLVEQNAKQALKIADHAYVLESGKVVKSGLASDLLLDTSIKEAYLGQ